MTTQGRIGVALFWATLFVIVVAEKAFQYELSTTGALNLIESAVLLLSIGLWIDADIKLRRAQHAYSGALGFGIVFLAPVVVPVYIIKTRGAKGTTLWFLRLAGCFLLTTIFAMTVVLMKKAP